jgi:hypothetical protein
VKLKVASRKLFGNPVQTAKANWMNLTETVRVASVLRSLEVEKNRFEDDIRL